jgi:hypothetical protein
LALSGFDLGVGGIKMKRTNRSRQMSHSDPRFDEKFQFSRQDGRIEKWLSPIEVLSFEIEEIVGPLTPCNRSFLEALMLGRYGVAEQAIAVVRSKMKFEEVSSRTGANDTGVRIVLLHPDKDRLLGFFVDPDDDGSLFNFMCSLCDIYDDDYEYIMIKILGTSAFDLAYDEFFASLG